ncbi:hypothetical protein [Acinetobacter nosocomialis]|uniref:hypothetical protein n=1 Tax=Acinetobacter nosocomialis TaxID=106654 RepID=UPI0024DE5706|nr:hypothetical protein [Acinetobacter nosocomialis]
MKPEHFIREYGVEKAREVVDGAPDWAKGYYEPTGQYQDQEWSDEMSVGIEDLKRLVESLDLVKKLGGLQGAKAYVPDGYKSDRLKQAIRDHESIYGGGDE